LLRMILIPVNAVPVDVQGPRQAVLARPATENVECRLGSSPPHKTARTSGWWRVIDQDHQHALVGTALEPVVVRPIHLHHRSEARPTLATLAVPAPTPPTHPQPAFLQQPGQRVRAHDQIVLLHQLLARQRRPEVRVTLLVQLHDSIPNLLAQPAIARPPTQAVNQTRVTR